MTSLSVDRRRPVAGVPLLVAFFVGAVVVRAALTGPPGFGASVWPGVLFGALLAVAAIAIGTTSRIGVRVVVVGVVATAALVLPALAFSSARASLPLAWFPGWMAATMLVAPAEEAFLRGVLYDAVARRWSVDVAIVVAAVAFGLMHVPLYGWHVVPLDLAVGLVLAGLRIVTRGLAAPAAAHAVADLATWWL